MRKPFQGVINIIRFNWHFFVLAIGFIMIMYYLSFSDNRGIAVASSVMCYFVSITTFISLLTSYFVYDRSNLYAFDWLRTDNNGPRFIVANIHAGFDESSEIIQSKLPESTLHVFDFYDPLKHTEVSIKRARKYYPAHPDTVFINTNKIPLENEKVDLALSILSAHEIRKTKERITFFNELRRTIKPEGHVIITEHLRDLPNFLAYNVGSFHFHSRKTWITTFSKSDFTIVKEFKITPFLTTFILKKNGTTS